MKSLEKYCTAISTAKRHEVITVLARDSDSDLIVKGALDIMQVAKAWSDAFLYKGMPAGMPVL